MQFPVGTDFTLALDEYPGGPPSDTTRSATTPKELAALLLKLPDRTTAKHLSQPSDWINLAFLGNLEQLNAVFEAAGWQTAERLSMRADVRTFFAVAEHHSYSTAPVSTLLVFGKEPDLVFQKQNNTFAKRHHIRIWSSGEAWRRLPTWIAAATHDVGIDFSRQARTFTHRVEPDIDLERAKVIRDLSFAGRAATVSFTDRPSVQGVSRNATGDELRTDGRLAVVSLR